MYFIFIYIFFNLHINIYCPFADPQDMKCGFDSHLCDFIQNTSDKTDWLRAEGTTPKPLTGPDHDHTTGQGRGLHN